MLVYATMVLRSPLAHVVPARGPVSWWLISLRDGGHR
jgi:hypothetical protein